MNPFNNSQFIGRILNERFRIEEQIGDGAVATVYRGTDLTTNNSVAIKQLLDTAKQADEAQITRFERESHAMEQLSHPSIVKVFDTIFVEGDHFIVMEYVGGGSLQDRLKRDGQLDILYALKVAHDIASAMILVHDQDIIHRDIKPDNILLSQDGTAKLTDFGMSRFTYMSRLTGHNMMLGSMLYMSPEQFKKGEAVKQSDIWAFGVMLYEILTGEKPFTMPHLIVTNAHTPVISMRPDVPAPVSAFVDKLLEKDPRQRFREFEDVQAELETLLK